VGTQVSVLDQFRARYGADAVALAPRLDVAEGISAARWMLEQPTTRFHPRCSKPNTGAKLSGLELLRAYRYQWDEVRQVYSSEPLHDYASHCADAFRGVGVTVRAAGALTRRPQDTSMPPLAVTDGHTNLTLNELIEQNEAWLRGRIRR
jgi:hypothetical protein